MPYDDRISRKYKIKLRFDSFSSRFSYRSSCEIIGLALAGTPSVICAEFLPAR